MTGQVSYTSHIIAFLTLVLVFAACTEQPATPVSSASSPTSIPETTPVQSSPSAIASVSTHEATSTAEPPANAPTSAPTSAATVPETIAVAGIVAATSTPVLPIKLITDTTLTSLRPLREVGLGRAVAVAIAPDGKFLAVATTAGVALVDLATMRPVRFDAVKGGTHEVVFSPDGTLLAASSNNDGPGSTTTVRQVSDGKVLASVDGDKPLFSPDGQTLATDGSGDGHSSTAFWHSADGSKIDELDGGTPVFSPDGQLIATAPDTPVDQPSVTQLWRSADRTKLARLEGTPLAFSPDGKTLATATEKDVRLWDDASGKMLHTLPTGAEDNGFLVAAFSADSKQVTVVVGNDVQTWSVTDGSRIATAQNLAAWDKQNDFIVTRSFSPYATFLAVFATQIEGVISGVRIVRVSDQHVVYGDSVSGTITFSPDGALAATVSSDGLVHVIATSDGSATRLDMPGFSAIAFSPEGAKLLTAGSNVYLWDVIKGSLERTLVSGNQYGLYGASRLQYSPNRRLLALETAFGAEGTLVNDATIWDLQAGDTGQQMWEQTAFASSELVSSFSPVGNASAWAHEGAEVHLQRSGGISLTLTMPVTVTALRFNPAGTLLASGDAEGNIALRDPTAPTSRTALQAGGPVQALEWSPDGTLLGAHLADGNLLVWRLGEQQRLVQLKTDADTARFIFSSDNRLLIAGGPNGVTFFRLSDGQALHTLPVAAQDLAIGPGRRLLAVLSDERVMLWGVE